MNYKPIRKIVLIFSIFTFTTSIMHISFLIITPSVKFTQGGIQTDEQERNVLIRETLLFTSIICMLVTVILFFLYVIINRKYHDALPIVQNNSVDLFFLISLAFLFISPVFLITLLYAFTIMMNLFLY